VCALWIMCGAGAARPCAAQARAIDPQQSSIAVHVFKSGLFKAFGDNHTVDAPIAEGSLTDSGTPQVQIVVDARRMRVLDPSLSAEDRAQVQTRMLGSEVLDTERFPRITFRSTSIAPLDDDHWLVHGDLELHGRQHPVVVKIVREDGRYKGFARLKQSDFGIAPISVAGGAVKVKDELTLDFDIATIAQ
jgi:hypothetical protein